MEYQNLILVKKEKIAWVTLNRPENLNSLNTRTLQELDNCFTLLDKDKEIRAVILTGSGKKAFAAGADIKEFPEIKDGAEFSRAGHAVFDRIENLSKPVIAAVNGFALGGGLEIALASHIRIASDNAGMGLPEVSLGLIPGYGGTQRLPKLIGKGRASQMIFTAEMISAQKALEIGLVNEVVPQDKLLERAEEIARKIIENSSTAIAQAIECVNVSDARQGFEIEINAFGSLFSTPDFKKGVTAFLEKRKPNF
ncbi:MAG: enoyl-CoA hydratase/isomerase family protein [Flavobacteriaceae bacterium]|jgi:enoyl-CoA hydratase|nr:enoyl-CoA hydratase/isomerase family protein [Flavobacteriaceae bacterium]